MLWTSLLFSTKAFAKETNPFRVYKDSKELDSFFEEQNYEIDENKN
jgi:hypothetical protein